MHPITIIILLFTGISHASQLLRVCSMTYPQNPTLWNRFVSLITRDDPPSTNNTDITSPICISTIDAVPGAIDYGSYGSYGSYGQYDDNIGGTAPPPSSVPESSSTGVNGEVATPMLTFASITVVTTVSSSICVAPFTATVVNGSTITTITTATSGTATATAVTGSATGTTAASVGGQSTSSVETSTVSSTSSEVSTGAVATTSTMTTSIKPSTTTASAMASGTATTTASSSGVATYSSGPIVWGLTVMALCYLVSEAI